jgi:hypothetical protein
MLDPLIRNQKNGPLKAEIGCKKHPLARFLPGVGQHIAKRALSLQDIAATAIATA